MRTAILMLALLFASSTAFADGVDGQWVGMLGTGPRALHLVLTITRAQDGSQHAVLDAVEQHSKIPVDSISTSNEKLRFEISAIGGVYEGTQKGDRIAGTWIQRGVPQQPLDLVRAGTKAASAMTAPAAPLKPPTASPLGPPLDVELPVTPTIADAHGQHYLAYELHVTTFGRAPLDLVSVELIDDGNRVVWASKGVDLAQRVRRVGYDDGLADAQLRIEPGARSVVFVWIPLPSGKGLHHRITIREADGKERSVSCARVEPRADKLMIGPPLRGAGWIAGNGPADASSHRRALIAVDGHAAIGQRFAIDWVRDAGGGVTYTGDAGKNASYRAYGAEAIAVAAATVLSIHDGIAENVPHVMPAVDRSTIAGNNVVLDLGGGRRAVYAHLQPGSLRVKKGDRVKRGQVLGLVGNTGNSSEPHLHFHVFEGDDALAGEGVPYRYDAFDAHDGDKLVHRKNEIPLDRDVVDFPGK